jgi:N-acyl-D-aspartate/D-glutamate deacylase
MKADINIIDIARLKLFSPEMVQDLPAGGQRLLQKAEGYRATIVSGEFVIENDELTGHRPGQLIRMGK